MMMLVPGCIIAVGSVTVELTARADMPLPSLQVTCAVEAFTIRMLEMRASSGGNYLALTCTIRATSREQLDALYRDLTGHPMVKVVL